MTKAHGILYVADQDAATRFYTETLGSPPCLHVPGMTEFALTEGAVELSPLQQRDWTDHVAYSLDPDGHVIAFARHADA